MAPFQPSSSNHHVRQFLNIPLANASPTAHTTVRYSSAALPPPLHLTTTREESTRVQLQQQRLKDHSHYNAVVVSQRIPGLKTSAAFFASLRTNLRLNASPPPSPLSTPPSMTASTGSLPPPSPLSFVTDMTSDHHDASAPELDPMASVPELKTYQAESDEDKNVALHLVAESVLQMKQVTTSALLYHPLNLAMFVFTLAVIVIYILDQEKSGPLAAATACTGTLVSAIVLCRWLTKPYAETADSIDGEWLGNAEVLVSKFGEEIIGTIIIDWVSGENRQKRKKPQRGEIKAWVVRSKYRKIGVGLALLEAAVDESRKKGAETIEFAEDHAHSTRVVPSIYNRSFDQTETKAREFLQDLLTSSPLRKKK